MRSFGANIGLASALLALTGCFPSGPSYEGPVRVAGVRALAITASPASGNVSCESSGAAETCTGSTVTLDLHVFDGLAHPAAREHWGPSDAGPPIIVEEPTMTPLSVAWLGGCHNPPGDRHFGCYPLLNRIASELGQLPADATEIPPERAPFVGVGTRFELPIPAAILEGRQLDSSAPPFGVSFVFFAACRGRMAFVAEPAADGSDGVPLRCEDEMGAPITDAKAFVRGFTTVYTYAGNVNRAPLVTRKLAAGIELVERECESDEDCADLASGPFGSVCAAPFEPVVNGQSATASPRCLPSVQRCWGPACEGFELYAELDPSSVERDTAASAEAGSAPEEMLWVKYYSLTGVSRAESLINDRTSGFNADYGTRWRPPPVASATPIPVWAVIQDNRGGASVVRWDFVVTD